MQEDEIYLRVGGSEKRLKEEAVKAEYELLLNPSAIIEKLLSFDLPLAETYREKIIDDSAFQNIYGMLCSSSSSSSSSSLPLMLGMLVKANTPPMMSSRLGDRICTADTTQRQWTTHVTTRSSALRIV